MQLGGGSEGLQHVELRHEAWLVERRVDEKVEDLLLDDRAVLAFQAQQRER